MLRQAFEPTPVRVHAFPELELGCTRAGDEPWIFEQRLDHVDAVVDRAFEVIQMVGRRAPQYDRRRPRLFGARIVPLLVLPELSEYGDTVPADFGGLKHIDVAGFFGGGRADACEGRSVDDAADSAEVKFGEDFEDGDIESVEVMEGKIADRRSSNDDFDPRISNLFEDLAQCKHGARPEGQRNETFSSCFSSPLVKLSISSALLMRTVPLVSVCVMSSAEVKTATLALVTFFMMPSGSRPNTMPWTTRLAERFPPMILTTRTLSTLKYFGLFGMTASAASATSAERVSSKPYCFEAMAGLSASASDDCVKGDGRLDIDRSRRQ